MVWMMPSIPSVIEWAVRDRPIAGELDSGDLHLVAPFAGGVLVGAVDGLGHGPEAAIAARAAVAVLSRDPKQPVQTLVENCHRALRGTRGVVLSLASIDATRDEMTWIGVGNVEAVLCRAVAGEKPARDRIIPRSGVVGYQLPPLRATTLPIAAADVIVFASDGLRSDFADESPFGQTVEAHATHLLKAYGNANDDALVLVVRYLGAA
jgi:negative regulator of sigma-B (phosphoserine phosphatase)